MKAPHLRRPYSVCVIDIGSPKLGNLGWSFIDIKTAKEEHGVCLDTLIELIVKKMKSHALVLGLEAPLFIPIRQDLMLSTKARKGEGRRPWSAGAGAQVLAINLPIMSYLFSRLKEATFIIKPDDFSTKRSEILLFEALVSGKDKGSSHIQDAQIMARYCASFSKRKMLPPTILEEEMNTDFLNLAAAALLQSGCIQDVDLLSSPSPIYKPTTVS
ncbi:MAG: hypothetical protein AAF984_06185 [Verrucomicrobiota bacterium]